MRSRGHPLSGRDLPLEVCVLAPLLAIHRSRSAIIIHPIGPVPAYPDPLVTPVDSAVLGSYYTHVLQLNPCMQVSQA